MSKKSFYSLNFQEALIQIKEQTKYKNLFKEDNLNTSQFLNNDFFLNTIVQLKELDDFSNVFFLNITKSCSENLKSFINGLKLKKEWALRVVDAYGKIPSGVLNGAFIWPGEYSECLKISSQDINFKHKHCTLTNPAERNILSSVQLVYGACVPEECNNNDISQLLNIVLTFLPFYQNTTTRTSYRIDETYVNCHEKEPINAGSITAIVVISIILSIVLIATIFDIAVELLSHFRHQKFLETTISVIETEIETHSSPIIEEEREKLLEHASTIHQHTPIENLFSKILRSFSAYRNLKKIFHVSKDENQLFCLHGIRVMSLSWVILGHTYIFAFTFADNMEILNEWTKRFSFMMIINAVFSVDTFFLLSGLLTSYIFMRELNKEETKLDYIFMFKYYVHRIWRLTPPYMIVLMISATLTKYIGNGPFFPNEGFERDYCRTTWWQNLIYMNNFFDFFHTCFPISWYLANDMQFHWIAPLIIIPFYLKKRKFGFIVATLLLISSFLSIGLILNSHNGSEVGAFDEAFTKDIYIKPWARIGPFIIGLIVGYLIYAKKANLLNLKLTRITNIIGWILSLLLSFGIIFALYPDFQGNPLSRTTHILYQCFSRTLWGLSIGFMIYSCATQNGGIINKILSWSAWVPLSRLSYSAYLIHPIVIYFFNTSLEHTVHMTDQTMIYLFCANLITSYASAIIVSILFEIPLIGLEKFIFPKRMNLN